MPQLLKCIGFVAALTGTESVRRKALQVEQPDVRRESLGSRGRTHSSSKRFLSRCAGFAGQPPKPWAEILHAPFQRTTEPAWTSRRSPPEQLLHTRASQDFGRARGDAVGPAMELLHGEAVNGRRLAHQNLEPRARTDSDCIESARRRSFDDRRWHRGPVRTGDSTRGTSGLRTQYAVSSMSGRSRGLSLGFLWIVFALFVVYGTTIPFHFAESAAEVRANLARLSPNPFLSPETGRRVSIPDTVQNVLLFLPFGLLGFLTLQPRLRSAWLALVVTTILGGLLSGGVEALQLLTVDRLSSVSDVVTNTAGAFSGALAAYLLQGAFARGAAQVAARGLNTVPAFQPALVAAVMVVLSAWEPFDFTLDVSTVVGKVRALAADPWQGGLSGDDLATLARFAIAGLAAVVWLRSLRVARPLAMGLVFGTVTALALEGSQLFITSRMPSGQDAVLHIVAVMCGALIGTGWPYGLGAGSGTPCSRSRPMRRSRGYCSFRFA